ncbi:hypothetical protein, partial [Bizionia saleffrena]|uniref:hypothetical protein n=1 Tax=Bizionia saleffrena TaxID=291189 RepID=UPI001C02862B
DNDSFVTGFLSKEGCTYTIEEYCSSGDHNDSIGYGDCGIDFYSIVITETCTPSGGGGAGSLGDSGEPVGNDTESTNTGDTNGGQTNNGGSGGSSSNGGVTTPTTPCRGDDCPEEYKPGPCDKITKLFLDYPNYKQALINLAGTVNQQVENGIYIDKASSTINTIPQGVGGIINFNNNPANAYITFAHTHDASGTYSIFSWDDLALMARAVENGKIKTNKFVAFLITAKGTRYALTIEDASKLTNFLYQPSGSQGTQVDVPKMLKVSSVFDKFYGDNAAVIKNTNTDNDKVQKAFLQMLRDNDAGVEIFEVDATFDNFTKLKLETNNTDVTPINCN